MNKVIIDLSLLLVVYVFCVTMVLVTYDIDYLLLFIHYYSSEQNEVLHACCTCTRTCRCNMSSVVLKLLVHDGSVAMTSIAHQLRVMLPFMGNHNVPQSSHYLA